MATSSSSPDPLTFVTSSPSKSAAARRPSKRVATPLAQLSPNVHRSDPFLETPDLGKISPSKSIMMTTPRTAGASPWRIKVTVEAEPQTDASQDENSMLSSPTRARSTRVNTQTKTIPLNDADGSSPVKRRGRPRKSDTAPVTTSQTTNIPLNDANGSSPVKRRGRPRKSDTAPVITQTKIIPLNDADGSSPVKRRGRPRKSDIATTAAKTRNGTPVRRPRKSITRSPDDDAGESSISDVSFQPARRGRPRKSLTKESQVPEPVRAESMYGPRSPDKGGDLLVAPEDEEAEHIPDSRIGNSTHRASGSRSSIGQRRRSGQRSARLSDVATEVPPTHSEEHEPIPEASATKDAEMWRSMVNNIQDGSEDGTDSEDDDLDIVMPDQTIGETTMLHSEEFSMVSIDSLPSMQVARNSAVTRPPIALRPSSIRTDPIPSTSKYHVNRPIISSPIHGFNDISVASVSYMPSSPPVRFPARTPSRTQKLTAPSAPPAIEQLDLSPSKPDTPKLVNVVKAGIALQGVVDGNNRGTFDRRPSDDVREDAQRARLDDLFDEFDSGTSRELRAGLRLGEQLKERARSRATTRETTREPSREPSPARPTTQGSSTASDGDVFEGPSGGSHQDPSRLLTPEEDDQYALPTPPPPPSNLLDDHPQLNVSSQQLQLISPARSQSSPDGDVASERENTPPSTEEDELAAARPQEHQDSVLQREPGESFDVYWERRRKAISKKIEEAGSSQVIVIDSDVTETSESSAEATQNELDGDIWEEEASRNSDTRPAGKRQKQNSSKLSANASANESSMLKSQHSKASRTWRRKSPENSQYSNEASAENPPARASSTIHAASARRRGKQPRTQNTETEETSEGTNTPDTGSEEGEADSTGIFWQNKSESGSKQAKSSSSKSNKLDLSILMGLDDRTIKNSPLASPHRLQPFKGPYNIGTGFNSPVKGSPLKRQVMFSSPSAVNSSPYHKIQQSLDSSVVIRDEETMGEESMTSDIRQLRTELQARPPRSMRRLSMSAAYDEEDRMVEEQIETEQTRDITMQEPEYEEHYTEPSIRQSRSHHMTDLNLNRKYTPLFEQQKKPVGAVVPLATQQAAAPEQSSGLLGRLWSAFGSAPAAPHQPPPHHPLAAHFPALPKVAPWTRTHYKTLGAVYDFYKSHPAPFNPTDPLNRALLAHKHPHAVQGPKSLSSFANIEIRNWGYEVKITPEMLVVCAVYMQLLTLEDAAEYYRVAGKKIDLGIHTEKGKMGEPISMWTVISRLFSTVAGEQIRKDERRGKPIHREVNKMEIKWPYAYGWWNWDGSGW